MGNYTFSGLEYPREAAEEFLTRQLDFAIQGGGIWEVRRNGFTKSIQRVSKAEYHLKP